MSKVDNKSLVSSILSNDNDIGNNSLSSTENEINNDLITNKYNNDEIFNHIDDNGIIQPYSNYVEPQPPRGLTASAFKRIQNYFIIAAGLEASEFNTKKGKLIQDRLLECFYRLISNELVIKEFPELGSSKILLRKTLKNEDTFDSNRLWHKYLDVKRHIIKEIIPVWSKVVTLSATLDKTQDELLLATRMELWNVLKISSSYRSNKALRRSSLSSHNDDDELGDGIHHNEANEESSLEFSELWYPIGWLAFLRFGPVSETPHPDFNTELIDEDNISVNTKYRISSYLNNNKRYSLSNVTGTVINSLSSNTPKIEKEAKRLKVENDLSSLKFIPKSTNTEFERQKWEREQEKWAKEFAIKDRQDKITRLEKSIKVCQELFNNPTQGQEGYDNLQKLREKYLKITSEGFEVFD